MSLSEIVCNTARQTEAPLAQPLSPFEQLLHKVPPLTDAMDTDSLKEFNG